VPRLFEPFALDLRSEERSGTRGWIPVVPCRHAGGVLRSFYHSDYFRSAARHADAPRLTQDEQALLDLYESIASEPEIRLDMELRPGDVQLVSNHTVIHARTAYEDAPGDGGRRHLLRLWLSLG
jgi:alpha-ketoglutarate-dependent taurine dioxygenase